MMAATGDTTIATPPRITRTVAPDGALAAAFDDGHARYLRAAQAILELT